MARYKNLTSQNIFREPPIPTYPMRIPADDITSGDMLTVALNQEWLRRVVDVISYMDQPDVWIGTDAEIDTARAESRRLSLALLEGSTMSNSIIGSILPLATATMPQNMLLCDGAQYARVNYPDLYNALSAALIVDADYFLVPDLRDKFILGAGNAAPLSTGGQSEVALAVDQMPAHTHDTYSHRHTNSSHTHTTVNHDHDYGGFSTSISIPTGPGSGVWTLGTPGVNKPTTSDNVTVNPSGVLMSSETVQLHVAGSGNSHQNMPPYVALAYGIVAN